MIDQPRSTASRALPLFLALLAAHAGDSNCTVGGVAVRADADRAVVACTTARARYTELFGGTAPRIHIVLHDLPGYEVASSAGTGLVFWPMSSALVPVGGASAPRQWVDRQWEGCIAARGHARGRTCGSAGGMGAVAGCTVSR
jgi:hypothetical protein